MYAKISVAALAALAGASTASPLSARADCRALTVKAGDSCGTLAASCGITGEEFIQYNPNPTLCSTLTIGQRVCCSAGDLPDITPKPNPDGTCASYKVPAGDSCGQIAARSGLTVAQLEAFQTNTWGWKGCNNLFAEDVICLSEGKPPLPSPWANAICGPRKPGTTYPTDGTPFAELNKCEDGSCCNQWGFCGYSPDFCGPDTCISNCDAQ